ncbi:MAG: hypothetical protein ACRDZ8_11050 [Acidimicrobiales bacterium]
MRTGTVQLASSAVTSTDANTRPQRARCSRPQLCTICAFNSTSCLGDERARAA